MQIFLVLVLMFYFILEQILIVINIISTNLFFDNFIVWLCEKSTQRAFVDILKLRTFQNRFRMRRNKTEIWLKHLINMITRNRLENLNILISLSAFFQLIFKKRNLGIHLQTRVWNICIFHFLIAISLHVVTFTYLLIFRHLNV